MGDEQVILALSPTQRDPDCTSIRVGGRGERGKVVATLGRRQFVRLDLSVGQVWDQALADRVEAAATFEKALGQALNRLGRRAMSRWEVERKLHDLGHAPEVGQRVIERLEEMGLLDDRAFGRALVRETRRAKAAGPALLRQKLRRKGVDPELADRLADEATADPDRQVVEATQLARKRLGTMQRLDRAARRRRLYGLLARRGFTPDTIRQVMDALRERIDGGDGEEDEQGAGEDQAWEPGEPGP